MPDVDEELTYGIDRASPNGDSTALTVMIGGKAFVWHGEEANAILGFTAQKCKEARRKQMRNLNAIIMSSDSEEDAFDHVVNFIEAELNGSGREE